MAYRCHWEGDPMNALKIALLQISPMQRLEENLTKGMDACAKAKAMGADIALFPEMWSNGYRIHDRPNREWIAEAIPTNGDFVGAFAHLAGELEMAIGVTLLEQCESGPKNTLVLFDQYGNRAMIYSKVHTCDFDVERALTPGDAFCVTNLDTAIGNVKVGAMICYDREFPESARILMLQGAEIVLVPNACPMEINRLSQLRARAYENMMGIATCNYPEGVPDCNGHSTAFDGMAYLPGMSESRDTCILEADGKEGIYMAVFDMDLLRAYRKEEMQGNTFRHPRKYGMLVEENVREPFIRDGYRG